MYKNTKWLDKVVDAETGELIQQGTDQSAANFNNMENGIHDAHVAATLLQNALRLIESSIQRVEVIEGRLEASATGTAAYPDGFTKDNCVVVSAMDSSDGTAYAVKAEPSISATLMSSGVYVANKAAYANSYKVALCKYK